MKIDVCGLSDVGKKRKINEDNFLCSTISVKNPGKGSPVSLLIVADGIGGHAGGDTASAMAVDILESRVQSKFLADQTGDADNRAIAEATIQEANSRIFQRAAEDPNLNGMGTTVVSALIRDSHALISNVGDSRAYLVRDNKILQITEDHSWKAEQLKLKMLSEEEITGSPFRHTITRSLGFDSAVNVDTFFLQLFNDDFLLLCSDGLYESLPDTYMMKLILKKKKPKKICEKLIKMANKKGGHDNITAVVALFTGIEKKETKKIGPSDTVKIEHKYQDIAGKQRVKDTVDLEELEEEKKRSPSDTVKLDI